MLRVKGAVSYLSTKYAKGLILDGVRLPWYIRTGKS